MNLAIDDVRKGQADYFETEPSSKHKIRHLDPVEKQEHGHLLAISRQVRIYLKPVPNPIAPAAVRTEQYVNSVTT